MELNNMMMQRTQFLAAIALVTAGGLLTGCNQSPDKAGGSAASDVIKVGEYGSLTGTEATFGQSTHKGIQMALDEINAAGGVLGKKLELHTEDDQSQAGQASTVVHKLISSDGVVAILGEVASSRSLEAAPICQQNGVPMISPSSTNPKVTEVGDYIFRVCFIDPFQGTVMANFVRDSLKLDTAAVLIDTKSDYSVGLAKFFKERFVAAGGKIVAEEKYSGGDKDFNAQLTAIKAANPAAVFVPGYYTEAGLIAMQARQLGLTVPLLGGDGWESDTLIPVGGAALEGDSFSTHFSSDDTAPVAQTFIQSFRKKFNETPDGMAALGYDSAMILADAIKRAGGTDGAKVRDAIAATKDFKGVTGSITIDAARNASKPAVILTIKDGKFKYLQTVAP